MEKRKRKKSMRNPNGFGGIVFLGEKRRRPYGVRFIAGYNYETGSGRYKYLGYYTTKLEAMKALVDYNMNPYDLDGRNLTFEEVYNLASEKAFKDASPQKVRSYTAAFKACSKIHGRKLSQIKTAELQKVIDESGARSKSSLNNIKIVFGMVYKYALKNDFVEKDYSQYVEIDDINESKEKSMFTEKEMGLLWENEDDIYAQIALVLIYTGFRINELLTVELENVNLKDGYIKHGLKTKSGKGRIVPIHSRIKSIVEKFYYDSFDGFLINQDGTALKYNRVKIGYKNMLKEIGIAEHTLHECRHTTASLLTRYGGKDAYIKKILGHSTNDITKKVYTHAELEDLRNTIELIP